MGDKLAEDVHNNVLGLLPTNSFFVDRVPDIILVGKLQFFERGFIFFDNRLGAFVVPFRDIKKVTFHLGELAYNNFMQVEVNEKGKAKLPA